MNVTLTLDDELVKRVRKVAAERETTMTAMVREYLESIASDQEAERIRLAKEALERSFERLSGTFVRWTREELYERR